MEAAWAALAHGFGPLGLAEVVAFTTLRNLASRRVMERIGMRYGSEGDPLRRTVLYRATGTMRPFAPSVRQRSRWLLEHEVAPFVGEGRLVRLLADWTPPFPGFRLYHSSRRQVRPVLAALIDELRRAAS